MTRPTACGPRRIAAGRLAPRVQLRHGHDVLVAGDLEHGVGGRVDDGPAGGHVLVAELLDDARARGRPVAEDPPADRRLERLDDLRREPVRVGRERPLEHHPHHLPVAGGRVLAGAALDQAAVGRLPARRSERQPDDLAQAERGEVGQRHVHALEHVPQRVRALVPVRGGVGQRAGAAAVQHAHEHTASSSLLLPRSVRPLDGAPAGASPGTPRGGARRSRECTTGWSPRWRGRASPARCAGPRPRPADAWRTSAGTCARWPRRACRRARARAGGCSRSPAA